MKQTLIEKYNQLQKDILSDFAIKLNGEIAKNEFRKEVKNFYGFESTFSWNILLNAFYIIEDTELAKNSFYKFQLQGPSRHIDYGEKYLRLYGILNAIYLQSQAIINLIEIHKINNKQLLVKKLKELDILKIRNKIGSHSSNYISEDENEENNFHVYEICRNELHSEKIILMRNQNKFEEYNLSKEIKKIDIEFENILSIILNKLLKKKLKNHNKYIERLENLDFEKNGGLIVGNEKILFK